MFQYVSDELQCLSNISGPRNCFADRATRKRVELHGFCDASCRAYVTVVYARVSHNDRIQIMLICSKSRVAPVKPQKIPRMELLGPALLSLLLDSLNKALYQIVHIDSISCWTDAVTVLCWIQNHKLWKEYVKRRVQEIRQLTQAVNWRHCPGEWNPAGLGTRSHNASTEGQQNLVEGS